ncbi:zinc-dependent alcohol dehydrogenase family protein [Escherichia coli]|nr:zinc-dependent alcohol dehydrogenase family protein [Escherichia coli]MED0029229.1 zinc-dependent alcohol dehydrogenase family protein [Escherichia coli]MED0154585.1 zinc-dependent alcohol dehydrogenase family protein [Escherichia coli]MED0186906.1 zinc-dependent alcohol dehydrogenase family protein [Escherichia coli]MED0213724.1 zinc-dependent alcohol dehydrogenase family protein [Escherichia coli]
MANVYRFHRLGGPEVLQLDELDLTPLLPDEVRVRIKSIGLNRADIMFRNDEYIQKAILPSRVGYEAAGEVVSVGDDVKHFSPGDAVCILPPDDLSLYGTYADEMNIAQQFLVHKPVTLTWEEASSVWMQYLTAWGGIIRAAKVKRGDFVLITAASSSVGIAAIQIARQAGAIPVAVTLDSDKKDTLLDMGAAYVIATDEEDLLEALTAITGPEGLAAAFDAVGGPQVMQIAQALGRFGRLIIHGALSREPTLFPLKLAIRKSLTVEGYLFAEVLRHPEQREEAKHFILNGLVSGTLKPCIDAVFPFEQMQDAQLYLEKNRRFGKVIVTV